MRYKLTLIAALLASVQVAHAAPPAIEAALSSSDRPDADQKRDADRKPAELATFANVQPGMTVADIVPGGGYFTRIFSNVVGPKGTVYAMVPTEFAKYKKPGPDAIKTIAASPDFSNVKRVEASFTSFKFPKPLDLAWTDDNYHDIYIAGADKALAFDRDVFAALKPGGLFVVVDHVAAAGTSATAPSTLHRIDPATIRTQVESVGFALVDESDVLRNKNDDHTKKVFDPSIRGKTDQVVLKFRKPV